ncbi:rna-directed dna polymerase from mobile element hypothetical protein [Limosa lapponica baueri]|uniref:Rna-directed dna polymerase from mobile element jockey-like n=1 Tax=Limosa lapponica baueri TaxID=1758121 RepID=A0A2I0UIZ7_LIMLA|nr:rna-directed dna polymerase from mobile element hypothetical protein [Limosa lapponica baueri]
MRTLFFWIGLDIDVVKDGPDQCSFLNMLKIMAGESQTLEVTEKVWTKEDFPLVEEDHVRDQLSKLDICKSVDPDRMHPRMLRELAEVTAGPLSIIFERSWRTGKVPKDWRKADVTPVFKKGKRDDAGNYRVLNSLNSTDERWDLVLSCPGLKAYIECSFYSQSRLTSKKLLNLLPQFSIVKQEESPDFRVEFED